MECMLSEVADALIDVSDADNQSMPKMYMVNGGKAIAKYQNK